VAELGDRATGHQVILALQVILDGFEILNIRGPAPE
jgi:hypothetical protein